MQGWNKDLFIYLFIIIEIFVWRYRTHHSPEAGSNPLAEGQGELERVLVRVDGDHLQATVLPLGPLQHRQIKVKGTVSQENEYNWHLGLDLTVDKLYTQIGKVFRLPWELNLLLPCFGLLALHSRIYWNSWPSLSGLTSLNCGTGTEL